MKVDILKEIERESRRENPDTSIQLKEILSAKPNTCITHDPCETYKAKA
jgi:hypothetical protein